MMMTSKLSMKWDLDSIFTGGSQSAELTDFIEGTEEWIEKLNQELESFGENKTLAHLIPLLETKREVRARISEISAFISCLTAQDVMDKQAKQLVGKRNQLMAQVQKLSTTFSFSLAEVADDTWSNWTQDKKVEIGRA